MWKEMRVLRAKSIRQKHHRNSTWIHQHFPIWFTFKIIITHEYHIQIAQEICAIQISISNQLKELKLKPWIDGNSDFHLLYWQFTKLVYGTVISESLGKANEHSSIFRVMSMAGHLAWQSHPAACPLGLCTTQICPHLQFMLLACSAGANPSKT